VIRAWFLIVRRSLRRHALSTSVTVASAALASGLVMAVFSISEQSTRAFGRGGVGFDAVLGARGSALQLVLNTVYHLETSPGNIPWSLYEDVKADPRVELAVPYAVGDAYRGFRVVGTTTELFTDFEYRPGERFVVRAPGRAFSPDHREAVVGAAAARELGLSINDDFHPEHGVRSGPHAAEHEEEYTVVGVLAPTNSPSDRVIWIPIEGIYHMTGHVGRDGEGREVHASPESGVPDEYREVSAVMLELAGGTAGFSLANEINRGRKDATLAWPIAQTMADLLRKLGWMNRVLELVAYLVVAVAAGSLLASLYNTMNERRREFAVLRALGARKSTVFGAIVLEASAIATLGAALGYAVYFGILLASAHIVQEQTGVTLDLLLVHPALQWTPLAMVTVGALSGLLPAMKAYATDVASHLNAT
jgi:putative ABC transport system permease protein